jgi:hypothetical protein
MLHYSKVAFASGFVLLLTLLVTELTKMQVASILAQ